MSNANAAEPRRLAPLLALLALLAAPDAARADRTPPAASIAPPSAPGRRPFARPSEPATGAGEAEGSGAWWLGPAGVALALAAFGGVSLASRRHLPGREPGPLRVLGRTSLSPKQSVYLLKAGDRVLLLGVGPQGPPSLLGELTDPDELRRLPAKPGASGGRPAAPLPSAETPERPEGGLS